MKKSYIYFLTNKNNTVLYIGITSNLSKRMYEHKTKAYKSFAAKYQCNKLVYYEEFTNINQAIAREKQLKSANRKRKNELIAINNSEWKDLSEDWLFEV